ncbi:RING-H2 finger protein ATL64 [Forsythia ovata]|uniref:RING-type E3 ubiquitin transferase n=1 Tax=Forsythia ovata TaxID=205694 RepID=A0ABD1VDV6_9LAMI
MEVDSHYSTYTAINGKIMLISVVIIVIACIIIVLFHLYARLFCPGHLRRNPATSSTAAVYPQGLDICVLKSLPTFIYASKNHHETRLECAVCLSEFEDNETGRILNVCKHCFHVDCIDMWLQSHSDCPLCRSSVQQAKNLYETIALTRGTAGTGSGSSMGCSSSSLTPAVSMAVIDVHGAQWPDVETGFKTPVRPVLSLERFLSL